jgi:hypothetical protein
MTKKEYEAYVERVDAFFASEGIGNLSRLSDTETYFSWSVCDCCGSRLGGDRVDANGYNAETKEIYEYTICLDCEYFAEYGRLDDMTMMDIEG